MKLFNSLLENQLYRKETKQVMIIKQGEKTGLKYRKTYIYAKIWQRRQHQGRLSVRQIEEMLKNNHKSTKRGEMLKNPHRHGKNK